MTDPNVQEPHEAAARQEDLPQPRPWSRRRRIVVAGAAAAGLVAGGAALTDASFASGGSTNSPSSAPSGAPKGGPAGGPGRGGPAMGKYDLDGTVTSASSSRLVVRNAFGTSRTYTVNSKTQVHAGPGSSSKLDVDDLDAGTRVHVHGEKSGSTYVADDVDVHRPHLDGSVDSVSGDTVTITDNDGFTRTITFSSDTTFTKDGKKSTRGAVVEDVVVRAEGTVDSDGTTLDATRVDVLTKQPARPAGPRGGGPDGRGPGRGGLPGGSGKSGSGKSGSGNRPAPPSGAPTGKPSGVPSGAPSAPSGSSSSSGS